MYAGIVTSSDFFVISSNKASYFSYSRNFDLFTMKIGFFDTIGWDYDIETPYRQPLGGSQSALCYLAVALAATGHEVWLYNKLFTI